MPRSGFTCFQRQHAHYQDGIPLNQRAFLQKFKYFVVENTVSLFFHHVEIGIEIGIGINGTILNEQDFVEVLLFRWTRTKRNVYSSDACLP